MTKPLKPPGLRQRDLKIETMSISALKPYSNNPRTHSREQVRQIAASIEAFGWTNPILVDDALGVIAGHGRLEAAKQLGLNEAPVVRLSDMTEAQKRAYVIADNKLAENAGWDENLLRIELEGLLELDAEFAIDIELTGFNAGEIDAIVFDGEDPEPETAPEPDPGPPVSRPGDLWRLGRHRLLCADALEPASYARLLGDERSDAVFTDPPYNVPIDRHVCGLGSVKHDEFAMASGEMSPAEFQAFLGAVTDRLVTASKPGSVHFICMDWRHIADLIEAAGPNYSSLLNLCVWTKQNGGMGSLYRSQHELVAVFKAGRAKHRNNVELGKNGRNRTNVWAYPGVLSRRGDLKLHPTVKPTAMVADAIRDVTSQGELVLDPFGGSGATLLAAERSHRRAALIEIEPKFVDVTIRRFRDLTGEDAVRDDGRSFSDIEIQQWDEEACDS